MEDIKRVQLSEIVELITKGTTPTTLGYEFQDEGINFLKIECFDENGGFIESKVAYISEECHKKMKRSQLKKGDILFSIAGAIGRVTIVTEEMLPANINQALAIIRISDEQVYLPYIKLILTSPIVVEQFERKKQGVAQLNLSLKDINEISIPLPSKGKQIELAEIFNKVVGVMSKRNRELLALDTLIKARFVEMFANWKEKYLAEPLGKYLQDITYGFTSPMPDAKEGPWKVTAKDVVNGIVNLDTARKTLQESYDKLTEKSKPQVGDVLLTKDGTLGRTAVVEIEGICVNQSVAVLRTNEKILPKYLSVLLQMPKYQRDMIADAGGGTIKHIYITKVVNMPIVVPSSEEQNTFLGFINQVDKSKLWDIRYQNKNA